MPSDEQAIDRVKAALSWCVLFPWAFARHLNGKVRWDVPRGKLLPQVLGMAVIWLAGTFIWISLVWALASSLSAWRGSIPDTMKQM